MSKKTTGTGTAVSHVYEISKLTKDKLEQYKDKQEIHQLEYRHHYNSHFAFRSFSGKTTKESVKTRQHSFV